MKLPDRLHRCALLHLAATTSWLLGQPVGAKEAHPVLRVAYFVPSDREPIPGYVERFDRVMREVQDFYREGMEQNGFGPLTFELDRSDDGVLRVHLVRAAKPMKEYGRNATGLVLEEVKHVLREAGLDPDRQHVVIFEALLEWKEGKAIEVGPYVGGGGAQAGTAWVYDDERLDPRLLPSKEPGGFYVKPCSLGEFNSHYIGGVAHELGHGLGLPHDRETKEDQERGHSLMGYGNHTYGRDLRGEGRGSFLSPASAMALARHPLITGEADNADTTPSWTLDELDFAFAEGKLVVKGLLKTDVPAYGLVAHNDPAEPKADYDATGWTCKVADDGTFRIEVGEINPGKSQLRLRACHNNGRHTVFRMDFAADAKGTPDVAKLQQSFLLSQAIRAFADGDIDRIDVLASQMIGASGWSRSCYGGTYDLRHFPFLR